MHLVTLPPYYHMVPMETSIIIHPIPVVAVVKNTFNIIINQIIKIFPIERLIYLESVIKIRPGVMNLPASIMGEE